MANEFETLISNFLIPDSNVIKESTIKLKEALKDPNCISKICQLIISSPNVMVRQYACVILRNKILKKRQWKQLKQNDVLQIQEVILKSLMQETEKPVLSMACNVMAHIIKHKFEKTSLNEFFNNLNTGLIMNPTGSIEQRERGCFILQEVLTPVNAMHFVARHLQNSGFIQSFNAILGESNGPNAQSNMQSAYYVVKCIISLLPSISGELGADNKLMDKWGEAILQLVQLYIKNGDEDKASDLVEYFMDLVECDCTDSPAVLTKFTFQFLQMVNNSDLPEPIRIKAVYFLRAMVVNKKKIVIKHKLLEPIIDATIPIFAYKNPDDELDDDFYEEESYQSSLLGSVTDLMEEIALNITPGKFLPHLLKKVEDLITPQSQKNVIEEQPYKQRGAYLILASVVPGCPAYIKQKYLDALIKCVINGVKSPHPVVQKAAYYALSYFSDSLQPEIINYHKEIMPLLYERVAFLSSALATLPDMNGGENALDSKEEIENCLIKAFTAFETFIENMDKDVLEPYLPTILRHMIEILNNPVLPAKLKEFSISAISATASAAEELMQPYFPEIIGILEKYLVTQSNTGGTDEPEKQKLQIQSIDALNMFSRCINPHRMLPAGESQTSLYQSFTHKCLEYSIIMLGSKSTDPDLKSVIYGLLGGLSALMKGEFSHYLPTLLPHFTESLSSTNEMMQTKEGKTEQDALTKIFDLVQDHSSLDTSKSTADGGMHEGEKDESDDDDTNTNDSFAVENAYIEEKENALLHLGEIVSNLGLAFIPYLQPMYNQVLPMINHAYLDVQVEAIKCLAQFCSCLATACPLINPQTTEDQLSSDQKAAIFAFNLVAYECLSKFGEIVRDDDSKEVVCAALEAINQIAKETPKKSLLKDCHLYEGIVTLVKRTINKKLKCQQETEFEEDDESEMHFETHKHSHEDEDGEDEGSTETDELLVQTGYECIPTLCACIGPLKFCTQSNYLHFFLKDITKKIIKSHTNKHQSQTEILDELIASSAERSFLLGVVADLATEIPNECVFEGKQAIVENLYRLIMDGLTRPGFPSTPDVAQTYSNAGFNVAEILSNAFFALGCLIHSNPWLLIDESKYPIIKFKIEQVLTHPKFSFPTNNFTNSIKSNSLYLSPDEQMLCDNCTAALCHIVTTIIHHRADESEIDLEIRKGDDLNKFIGLILQHIPLIRDQTENKTVYKCLITLWTTHNRLLIDATLISLLTQGVMNAIIKDKVEGEAEINLKQLFALMCQSDASKPFIQNYYGQLTLAQQNYINPLLGTAP